MTTPRRTSLTSRVPQGVLGGLPCPALLDVVPFGRGHLRRAEAAYVARGGSVAGLRRSATPTNGGGDDQEGPSTDAKMSSLRKIEERELPGLNYYELLGLDSFGLGVTEDTVKKAYRQALLLYHPDKKHRHQPNGDESDDDQDQDEDDDSSNSEEDDSSSSEFNGDAKVFLAVQKAFEVLSNESTRRAYDSTNDFDDEIPTGREAGDFYAIYAPVFKSNARFATRLPVPDLGKDSDDERTVEAFYAYWFSFDSWRDFGLEVQEHDVDQAEDRFEKRWMVKENDKLAKKRKKEEYNRIVTLVERARANDPRIRRFAEEKAAVKRRRQEAKVDAQRAKEVATEAKAFLEQLEKERRDKVNADQAKERKAVREKQKKAKRRAEKALWALIVQGRKDKQFATIIDDDSFEALSATLEADEFVALADIASNTPEFHGLLVDAAAKKKADPSHTLDCLRHHQTPPPPPPTQSQNGDGGGDGDGDAAAERNDGATTKKKKKKNGVCSPREAEARDENGDGRGRHEQERRNGASKNEKGKAPKEPWSDEELSMLAKAVKKFPAGARQRWEGIADYVSAQLRLPRPRTKDECIAKYHEQQATPAKPKAELPKKNTTAAAAEPTPEAPPTKWTPEQQKQLEAGLAKYPASLDANDRWKRIAADVQGRTKKECVERYKELRKGLQAGSGTGAAPRK